MHKRGFSLPIILTFLGVIALLVLGVVILFGQSGLQKGRTASTTPRPSTFPEQTPSPSSSSSPVLVPNFSPVNIPGSWKTFRSSKLNFTVRYPEKWRVMDTEVCSVCFFADGEYSEERKKLYYVMVNEISSLPSISFINQRINNKNTFVSDKWPGQFGTLSYFSKRENGKYLAASLQPYDGRAPFLYQGEFIPIFQAMVLSLQF